MPEDREDDGEADGRFGGLLGWDAQDERLVDATAAIRAAGIQVELRIADFGDPHPNTYRLTLKNADESRGMIALSTGGGMIEVIDIDGFPLSLKGDYFETLIYASSQPQEIIGLLKQHAATDDIALHGGGGNWLIQVKTQAAIPPSLLSEISSGPGVAGIRTLGPVLPVLSRNALRVPFSTCAEMLLMPRISVTEYNMQMSEAPTYGRTLPEATVDTRIFGVLSSLLITA